MRAIRAAGAYVADLKVVGSSPAGRATFRSLTPTWCGLAVDKQSADRVPVE